MTKRIWFMEGFSSQREIILAVKDFASKFGVDIEVFASHREHRNEILSVADYAFIEPSAVDERLQFVIEMINQYHIDVLHIVKHALWFEQQRTVIEATGVKLITGASNIECLTLAQNKMDFARFMEQHHLPVVPSILINHIDELKQYLANPPFKTLCIKPVEGIYGMGFWRFDSKVAPSRVFSHPEQRTVAPDVYLQLHQATDNFKPSVLMPYLSSPEYSVDIVASNGEVLAAVARGKYGSLQKLNNNGAAFELACQCARIMQADGLVNVQTRNNEAGEPLLLEINMRPSGGVGNTLHSGVNLPALMVMYYLQLMTKSQISEYCLANFKPVEVCSISSVIQYPQELANLINV